jgi:hypothetical protein
MDNKTKTDSRYRYRSEGDVSSWMTGNELQDAARNGRFQSTCEIQMAGHAEWKMASEIRGLSFTPVEIDATEPEQADEDEDRLTRFNTIRELMAAFTRQDIDLNLKTNDRFDRFNLCAISTDHFEVISDTGGERTFIPLHQVRSIVALDTGKTGSNYRDNHLLRITLI